MISELSSKQNFGELLLLGGSHCIQSRLHPVEVKLHHLVVCVAVTQVVQLLLLPIDGGDGRVTKVAKLGKHLFLLSLGLIIQGEIHANCREKRKPMLLGFRFELLSTKHTEAHLACYLVLIERSLKLEVIMPFRPKTMDRHPRSVILSLRLHVNDLGHSVLL